MELVILLVIILVILCQLTATKQTMCVNGGAENDSVDFAKYVDWPAYSLEDAMDTKILFGK